MKTLKLLTALVLLLPFAVCAAGSDKPLDKLVGAYLEIKNALARDQAGQAAAGAAAFAKLTDAVQVKALPEAQQTAWSKQAAALKRSTAAIAASKDLAVQRQAFAGLSKEMIAMVKLAGTGTPLYVQHCPMAKKSWLNENKAVENPYYGSEMFACGSVTETLPAKKQP
ncbi:hypothetical protein C7T94_03050 [Pedobacter yulinensis]|uniref:DUF3347 domain-containing protein n=1 Tax=Pedobacter yulinensis TaxID=2126353 RepID=A0A2T3HRL7_9SPHI|nr:DUF3347 domain-containing protein [Pedobacter yulinensis]PST85105.1 hypothetical protein C7T94_03050 [Pedobacter yulinensis]